MERLSFQADYSPDGSTLALATSENDPDAGRVHGIARLDLESGGLHHLVGGAPEPSVDPR